MKRRKKKGTHMYSTLVLIGLVIIIIGWGAPIKSRISKRSDPL
ncbi:MAG: hypothetical protein ABIL68_03780 [bacterium]